MSNKKNCEQGAGAPSFCWVCFSQLQRAPGKGKGLFYFRRVIGRDGMEHRIHDNCLTEAQADGAKLVKPESVSA